MEGRFGCSGKKMYRGERMHCTLCMWTNQEQIRISWKGVCSFDKMKNQRGYNLF